MKVDLAMILFLIIFIILWRMERRLARIEEFIGLRKVPDNVAEKLFEEGAGVRKPPIWKRWNKSK